MQSSALRVEGTLTTSGLEEKLTVTIDEIKARFSEEDSTKKIKVKGAEPTNKITREIDFVKSLGNQTFLLEVKTFKANGKSKDITFDMQGQQMHGKRPIKNLQSHELIFIQIQTHALRQFTYSILKQKLKLENVFSVSEINQSCLAIASSYDETSKNAVITLFDINNFVFTRLSAKTMNVGLPLGFKTYPTSNSNLFLLRTDEDLNDCRVLMMLCHFNGKKFKQVLTITDDMKLPLHRISGNSENYYRALGTDPTIEGQNVKINCTKWEMVFDLSSFRATITTFYHPGETAFTTRQFPSERIFTTQSPSSWEKNYEESYKDYCKEEVNKKILPTLTDIVLGYVRDEKRTVCSSSFFVREYPSEAPIRGILLQIDKLSSEISLIQKNDSLVNAMKALNDLKIILLSSGDKTYTQIVEEIEKRFPDCKNEPLIDAHIKLRAILVQLIALDEASYGNDEVTFEPIAREPSKPSSCSRIS